MNTHSSNQTKDPVFQLTDIIRETGFAIHQFLGSGHLEKVYERSLKNRLRKMGHKVESQKMLKVFDEDGSELGEFYADLVVDDVLILELKASKDIVDEHVAQLLGYLRASGIEHGAIVNFGGGKFQIRKLGMKDRPGMSRFRRMAQAVCSLFI